MARQNKVVKTFRIGGKPSTHGKVNRNTRTSSGFMEHQKPTRTTTNKAFDRKVYMGTMEGSRLPAKNKKMFGKTTPKKSGIYASKLPGKGSPKRATPSVKPKPMAGKRMRASGAQTKSSPKLVGY